MTIATETRTDAQIQAEVLAELKWEPRVQSTEIGVAVKDGIVTLTGWVDSFTKRWAAEEAAHRVRGVKAVANDIEVKLGIGAERTDSEIAAAAVRALQWDALLVPEKIDVTVSKGWITLKGTVDWQYKKHEAERGCQQPDRRQTEVAAGRNQEAGRAGAGAQCADRRRAHHRRGRRQQGHAQGHGACVGRARGSRACRLEGAGCNGCRQSHLDRCLKLKRM